MRTRGEVIPELLVVLIDVLHHAVRPGFDVSRVLNMIDLSLLSTGTAEPSAEEGDEREEEPKVAKKSQKKLSGIQSVVVDDGHDEERSEDGELPHSRPEMNLSKAELLSQTESSQGDPRHKAVS